MLTAPVTQYLFLALSMTAALGMMSEALWIILSRKQITPLPSRGLYGIGSVALGSDKSKRYFIGRATPSQLRTYAILTFSFGLCILISSFIYLFATVL